MHQDVVVKQTRCLSAVYFEHSKIYISIQNGIASDTTTSKDTFDVEKRIENDLENIKQACAKYIRSIHPWLPIEPQMPKTRWNYFRDKSRKIGWCFNPKVSKFFANLIFINFQFKSELI